VHCAWLLARCQRREHPNQLVDLRLDLRVFARTVSAGGHQTRLASLLVPQLALQLIYFSGRLLAGSTRTSERGTLRNLQSVLVVIMDDIKSNIKVWLNDYLLHTMTADDLLATLNFFFKQCQKYGLKLHASKCMLFATTVKYCGRLTTKDGVRLDPNNMESLQAMQEQQNGADLVQYVAAVKWIRRAIPNYSKHVAPLQAALAKVFEGKSRVLPPGPM
jgi:hypothetical protein